MCEMSLPSTCRFNDVNGVSTKDTSMPKMASNLGNPLANSIQANLIYDSASALTICLQTGLRGPPADVRVIGHDHLHV